MSTLNTFISMFETFLNELVQVYPNHTPLKTYLGKFDVLKKSNPRKLLELFMEHIRPVQQYVQEKNESVFLDELVPFLKDMDFKSCWLASNTDNATKQAIWAHLSSLLFFATTISHIPEGLMNNIEALAQQYAGQMNDLSESDMGLNPEMLLQNMQNMMSMTKSMNKKNPPRIV